MRAAILATVLLLAACSGPGGATPTPDGGGAGSHDIVGAWVLERAVGPSGPIAIPDGMRITLLLDSDAPGGQACNHYGVDVRQSGERVELRMNGSTDMACDEPIMTAEAAYTEALHAVTTAERRDPSTLVLRGEGGTTLEFTLLADAPDAELVGTAWMLDTLADGDMAMVPIGEPATLAFGDDATLTASTGCRELFGVGLRAVADQLVMTTFGAVDASVECPGDLGRQDSHVVEVLGGGFIAEIDGDLLTLRDPGGLSLVYRAAD